jgi:hypothetical protein
LGIAAIVVEQTEIVDDAFWSDRLLLCTFVSFVVDELQLLEPQRTQRYTKETMEDQLQSAA